MTVVNTNISFPQSPFLDARTGRPAREWQVWLQYPNVIGVDSATPIGPNSGGTGISSYVVGDLLVANTTTTLTRLADVATGNALISGGVAAQPTWGKIGLQTHVSGTLQANNGGTGQNNYSAGDTLYYAAGTVLSKLSIGANGYVMLSSGTAPQWVDKVPVTSGGTNKTSWIQDGIVFASSTTALNAEVKLKWDGTYLLVGEAATGNGRVASKYSTYCFAAETTTANTADVYYMNFISSTGVQNGYIWRPTATGITALVSASDARLKTDIRDADFDGLKIIQGIKVREFKWKDSNAGSVGFIAQELYDACADAVAVGTDDADGNPIRYWGVSREALIPYLVKAIQQLKAEFEAYKAAHP